MRVPVLCEFRTSSVRCLSLLVAASLAITGPTSGQAVGRRTPRVAVSAPITDVHYEVTVDSAATADQLLSVVMTFRSRGPGPLILALPAWTPGHYTLLWFARRVFGFTATSQATPLRWRKLDYQTWQIDKAGPGPVRIAFQFITDTLDRAGAWTSQEFAFFNGTNLFLYPVGRGFDWPASVTIHTRPGWRIATGMEATATPATYRAATYHDLVDMPFFVGRFDFDSTRVGAAHDHWLRVATYPVGAVSQAHRTRALDWFERMVPAEAAVFREIPWNAYTVLQVVDTSSHDQGGLEHQNSQLDHVDIGTLDEPGLAWFYAHETFHSWNVKRLRPADLVPYRYDRAQPTPWLWVSEGLTNYYGHLALVRSGISDSTAFLESLSGEIEQGTFVETSVADASLSIWVSPKDGTDRIYYPRGDILGFLLDILIRDASGNRRSLDDVMRGLYASTYRSGGRGFTADEWWGAVSRAAGGRSFAAFDRRYVTGREPLPFDSVLPLAGLRLARDTVREPRFGLGMATDSGGMRVTQVIPGGAGARGGLREGDVVESIGDVPITVFSSWTAMRARYASTSADTLPVVIRRSGQKLTLRAPVDLEPRLRIRLQPLVSAGRKAVRIRDGIMRGQTGATSVSP